MVNKKKYKNFLKMMKYLTCSYCFPLFSLLYFSVELLLSHQQNCSLQMERNEIHFQMNADGKQTTPTSTGLRAAD